MTMEQLLSLVKDLGPTVTTMGSAIWIIYIYRSDKEAARAHEAAQAGRENVARMFEARKPFNEKQLALYSQAAEVTGKLVTITDFDSIEWGENNKRFRQLFWTELSMVEDDNVKAGMQAFR